MIKTVINKDNYNKAMQELVRLEEEAITGIKVEDYKVIEGKYVAIEATYRPKLMRKIDRAEKKVYKEAKKLGISRENAFMDIHRNTKDMRRKIRLAAEKIVGIEE